MLPGPPSECEAMIDKYVLPYLKKQDYCTTQSRARYLTMGLIEGQISEEVDKIAHEFKVKVAYCWQYPFLAIHCESSTKFPTAFLDTIEHLLGGHVVSRDSSLPSQRLQNLLDQIHSLCALEIHGLENCEKWSLSHDNLKWLTQPQNEVYQWHLSCTIKESTEQDKPQLSVINVTANYNNKPYFTAQMSTPRRDNHVRKFYEEYIAWQLCQLLSHSV